MATKVNGIGYDGSTVEVDVEGVGKITGIEAINYGFTKEVTKVKGVGRKYIGRTPGVLNPDDGSMDIWLSEFNNWIAQAGSVENFMDSQFDATITYRLNDNSPLITVVLKDCTPINYSAAHATAGSDALVVTVNFSVMDIVQ